MPNTFPVESFEDFMLAGDSPDFPISFVYELQLDQSLNSQRLDQAVTACAGQHPILFSTMNRDRPTAPRWHYNGQWAGCEVSLGHADHVDDAGYDKAIRIDLRIENGLRILVSAEGTDPARVAFVFHHSCVDGIGAIQFMRDVMNHYNADVGIQEQPRVDPQAAIQYLTRHRTAYGGNRLLHFLRWPLDTVGTLLSFEMLFNRPVPLQAEDSHASVKAETNSSVQLSQLNKTLNVEETLNAKQTSKNSGQTLNDRAMEALFLAIQDWHATYNPAKSQSLFRIMVPMNLRCGVAQSAANMVAMLNFDRKAGKWKSRQNFRTWLRREMAVLKRIRAGVVANRYLKLEKLIFGRWKMQEDPTRCYATCVISNLGDVSRALSSKNPVQFGDAKATGFRTMTPLRSHTNVFVCVYSYLGELNLDATYNADSLTADQVEFLLETMKGYFVA